VIAAQDLSAAPAFEKKEIAETTAKVFEIAQASELTPPPVKEQEPAKFVNAPAT
jgi:hypothetical protein